MIAIVAWVLCLVAAIVGLVLKDVRLHAVTLAVSLAMLILIIVHGVPR